MNKLKKTSIPNINKHHQKTIASYFVLYVTMKTSSWDYVVFLTPYLVMLWAYFFNLNCSFMPLHLHCVYTITFHIKIDICFLKYLDNTTFEAKMSYYREYDTFFRNPMCHLIERSLQPDTTLSTHYVRLFKHQEYLDDFVLILTNWVFGTKVETPIHDNIREFVTWECKEHIVKS